MEWSLPLGSRKGTAGHQAYSRCPASGYLPHHIQEEMPVSALPLPRQRMPAPESYSLVSGDIDQVSWELGSSAILLCLTFPIVKWDDDTHLVSDQTSVSREGES